MKVKDKVIVVTGGGNGMGREVVLQLLKKDARVAAIDINEKGLTETKEIASNYGDRLSIHVANIADYKRVNVLPTEVIAHHQQIDGMMNVAGIIQPFIHVNDLDFDRIERVMNVNFYGTLYMIKSFLPYLLKRPEAHILNVSSMGGFLPVPGQTIYGASKAAVKLLTEGLFTELLDTPVDVTIVFPGGVATNITGNSGVVMKEQTDSKSTAKLTTPAQAAMQMIRAVEKNKYRIRIGKDAKIMDFLYRLAPKKAAKLITKQLKRMTE